MDPAFLKSVTEQAEQLRGNAIKAAGFIQQQASPAFNKFKDEAEKASLYIQTQAEPAYLSLLNKLERTYKSADEKYGLDEKKALVVDFVRENHLDDPDAAVRYCKTNTRTCTQIAIYLGMIVTGNPMLAGAAKMAGLCSSGVCSAPLDIVWQSSIGDAARERIFSTLQSSDTTCAGEECKTRAPQGSNKIKTGEDFLAAAGSQVFKKAQEMDVEGLKAAAGDIYNKWKSWGRESKEKAEDEKR